MTPHEAILETMSHWFLRGVPKQRSRPGEAVERARPEVREALRRLTSADTVEISRGMALYVCDVRSFAGACGMTEQQLADYDARLSARIAHWR